MKSDTQFGWLMLGLLGMAGACSSDEGNSAGNMPIAGPCTPNAPVACQCANGTMSTQICNPDGMSVTPCACDGQGGPATGGAVGAGGSPAATGGTPVGNGGAPAATGGAPVGNGGMAAGPGTGGVIDPGAGGVIDPGAGGVIDPGTGGMDPGTGGVIDPGTGGTPGDIPLEHCDLRTESSANPNISPCGSLTTPRGEELQLGPYGAKMDTNTGFGYENADPLDSLTCAGFAAIFGEDPALTAQLLDVGSQPCNATAPNTGDCLDQKLYSVYSPVNWPEQPLPVLVWGNGTCAQPEGYGSLLRYIASHGFVVIAPNSRQIGSGAQQRKAIDFAEGANADASSPYFGHLDLTKVGAMGHSQGGAGTALAAADPRIKAVILYNGGSSASKPFLGISGDLDIAGIAPTQASLSSAVNAASKAAYIWYHDPAGMGGLRGHLVLMMTPGRVGEASVAWWKAVLLDDPAGAALFINETCPSCGSVEMGQKGL